MENNLRRTKIVCTVGPASANEETLYQMILAGMDVARFNFSHGSQEDHGKSIELVRKAAKRAGRRIGIMLDTRGPEIRLGRFSGGRVLLRTGDTFRLVSEEILGTAEAATVSHKGLYALVRPGSPVLLDDGNIQLEVLSARPGEVVTRVLNDGPISDRKKVSLPGAKLDLPAVDEKDASDIAFCAGLGVDFVAASFIRTAKDVEMVRQELAKNGSRARIIAKIESVQGVENLQEILSASDGLMVARGDLGVELPPEEIPIIQKKMIASAMTLGKPVITATQMLESMVSNPRPTRAEASDVANAILDGTDAVMLSGETASGKYPVEAVRFMARIARRTEEALDARVFLPRFDGPSVSDVTEAVSHAAVTAALELNAKAIVTPSESGYTARMVARFRPRVPVYAVTPHDETCGWLTVVWGVQTMQEVISGDVSEKAMEVLMSRGLLKPGDLCVITKGVPFGVAGTTNVMEVRTAGKDPVPPTVRNH